MRADWASGGPEAEAPTGKLFVNHQWLIGMLVVSGWGGLVSISQSCQGENTGGDLCLSVEQTCGA